MRILAAMICIALAACGAEQVETTDVASYNIDPTRITVSGVSAGAMMATQFHVAHSELVGGAGLVAGGPYYCAENSLQKGLGPCMQGGDMNLDSLVAYALESSGIDSPENLADDAVWVFHGANDAIMHPDTTAAAAAFYEQLAGIEVAAVTDVPATHGFPSIDSGPPCNEFAEPYVNSCDYDAAGILLAHIAGDLEDRGDATAELIEVPQPGSDDATMLAHALAYVPAACASGDACGVHIAFHGCQQSTAYVGDAFARLAGFNEWAESNHLIVLYPQVDSSAIAPLNPNGCWDWWGYTGEQYATRNGPQIQVIKATLDLLAGKAL